MSGTVFHVATAWVAVLLGVIIWRLAVVDSPAQRILLLDLLTLVLIGLLALAAGDMGRAFPLDAALGLALLSSVATLAAARYYEDRRPYS